MEESTQNETSQHEPPAAAGGDFGSGNAGAGAASGGPGQRRLPPLASGVLTFALGCLLLVGFVGLFEWGAETWLDQYIARLGRAMGLDPYMILALTWALSGIGVAILKEAWLPSWVRGGFFGRLLPTWLRPGKGVAWKRKVAKFAVWGAPVLYFVLLSHYRGSDFFDEEDGSPRQWYVVTSDGVKYSSHPGVDPDTGLERKPVTPEQKPYLDRVKRGAMNRVDPNTFELFSKVNGAPTAWYYRAPNGAIEVFDAPGFHPTTSEALQAMTAEVAAELKKSANPGVDIRPSGVHEITDLTNTPLFDSVDGKPNVWFYRDGEGRITIYDRDGYHPKTGEPLQPLTPEIALELPTQGGEEGGKPGVGAGDGRIIDPENAVLFDPSTGKARVWFYSHPNGRMELFKKPGYHPITGVALEPMTSEAALQLETQKSFKQPPAGVANPAPATTPRRIFTDPRDVEFFDPASGMPKVWYARNKDGGIELYDSGGYSPADGTLLKVCTKEIAVESKTQAAKQEEAETAASKQQDEEWRREEAQRELKERQEEARRIREEQEGAAKEKAESDKAAENDRMSSLGVSLKWNDEPKAAIVVVDVLVDSMLADKVQVGDIITQVNRQPLKREGDPRKVLFMALERDGRLDLAVNRRGIPYSVTYKTRAF